MKRQKGKRILAAVLLGSMLFTGTAGAAEPETAAQKENETGIYAGADASENTGTDAEGKTAEDTAGSEMEKKTEAEETVGDAEKDPSGAAATESGETDPEEETDPEKKAEAESADAEAAEEPDERTQQLLEEYEALLNGIRTCAVGTYATELARFPASYKPYLEDLHKAHPNWIFVAMNRSLNWDDVVSAESISGSAKGTNRSLLPKTSAGILLSKASTDYNTKTGAYVAKDGQTWVSASYPAVAYNVDPRNFLTDNYIFMFEALNYNSSYHSLQSVENALKGTDLANKTISYTTTDGRTANAGMTYGEAVFAAGKKNKVSPLFLAAKIRQETGAKLSNGSISGKYSYNGRSYQGYYNFYNIGAYATSTGSAVENGLIYAKGGKDGRSTSYGRPWTSPLLAIDGGAQFLASSYIGNGQNTIYYQKFNTAVAPYYQHQYMQNLTAAASEAKTTCNSYKNMGILEDAYVFYIPVYNGMPLQDSTVSIGKSVKTGKTTSNVVMRKGASTGAASIITIPKGKTVTVSGAIHADMSLAVSTQEANPYWYKVTYGSNTGYVSYRYVDMDTDSTIKAGAVKQLNVSCSGKGEKIYYETSDPAVATVSASGQIRGVKSGSCDIYAVTGSGKKMDPIGITVSGTASKTETSSAKAGLSKPKLSSVSNAKSGITVKWKKVSGAKGYYVYRRTSGSEKWTKIKTISSGSTVKYTDKTMKAGKKYDYTVGAYKGSQKSGYDSAGLTIRRLTNPSLRSASGTKKGIKVRWKKVKSAVSYEIYRKKKGGKFKKIAEVKKGSTQSYTDRTAKKRTTYYYTVRARSGIYKGAYNSTGVKGKRK